MNTKQFLTRLLCAALALGAIAAGASYAIYGRSLRASLYEIWLRQHFSTERTAEEEIQRLKKKRSKGEKPAEAPEDVSFQTVLDQAEFQGMRVFRLNGGAEGGPLVVYLHGGAFINSFNSYQWRFMDRLAAGAGCTVIAPDYHLSPYADYARAYDDLIAMYRAMKARYPDRRLFLMGDSAGGGLALGLAECLAGMDEPLPDALILFSPWVDLSMENPDIEKYVPVDPILHLDLVKVHGRLWAGSADTRHWMVSPLYGDMTGLPPVTLYCGTRELLYPDILLCRDRLAEAGVDVTLHIGRGLNHDYPLMPIPEGEAAVREVVRQVRE